MSDEPPLKKVALDLSKSIPETITEIKETIKLSAGIPSNESQEFKKLEKVFELLLLSEQKTCRLVCKLWNEVASSVMIKQDRCQISIEYFRVTKYVNLNKKTKATQTTIAIYQKVHNRDYGSRSLHSDYQIKEEKSLTELIKCIKNSVKFPCVSFGFSFCDLSAENVINLFSVIGQQIKTLCIHETYGSHRTPLNAFRDILQVRAPNVQKLQVNYFCYKWTDDDNLSLPSLTHLIFEKCYWDTSDVQTIKRILEAANNLKIVDGFPLCLTDLFVETEKTQVIKSLTFSQLGQDESIDLADFANSKPCLRFFSFGCERKSSLKCLNMQAKLAKAFSSILESSKDTLRELKVGDWYYMNKEKIPRLQNLKELSIVNTRSPIWDGTFFPPGVNLYDSFPNIVYLCLELIELNDNRWIGNIPITRNFVGQLTTVKTLKISKLWDKEWLKTLQDMCPNFENLIVTTSSTSFVRWNSSSDFFTKICDLWPHLKGLEIVVTEEDAEMPNLDPILTGLSWEDCRILAPNRNSKGTQMDTVIMPEYGEMKRNQSILDLKDLRIFKLLFDLKTDDEWSSRKRLSAPWHTISMISVVYGFNLIPGLKVTIGWDHDQDAYGGMNINLKELSQFVNFIHWKSN